MPDEPITNAELARRLEYLGGDLRSDLHELKTAIDKLVLREVYVAERSAFDARLAHLEAEHRSILDRVDADRKAATDRQTTSTRWVVSTIAVPVIVLIIQILLAAKGIKP